MAGLDPDTLGTALQFAEGKSGGGYGGGGRGNGRMPMVSHAGGGGGGDEGGGDGDFGGGDGGGGLDPQSDFDLHERNLEATSHFARLGMGPSTSAAMTFAGNRRAARADAYNNEINRQLKELQLLQGYSKLAESFDTGGGFEAGYKSKPPATPESGFNPKGSF